jgi:hypothetical protein
MATTYGPIHSGTSYGLLYTPLSISPTIGTFAGSTHVVIAVTDSSKITSAAIDGINLTSFAIDDATHVSGNTVAHAVGPCNVTVSTSINTTRGASGDPLANGYSFYDPAFNPMVIGTPKVWLDSTNLTQGSGIVTAIVDGSSSGTIVTIDASYEPSYTATNINYVNQPTFNIDNTGNSQFVRLTNHGITTGAFTVVFVGNGKDRSWMGDGSGNVTVTGGGGSGDKFAITEDASTVLTSTTVAYDVPGVYIAVFNGTSSKLYTSAITATATGTAGPLGDLTGGRINVGNYGSFTPSTVTGMNGSIRHFILYSGALNQTDCASLLTNLGAASGLVISS